MPAYLGEQATVDYITLLRRLWSGETVSYHGPAGDYPSMRLHFQHGTPPPRLVLGVLGRRSCALAGEHCDGVLLPPFLPRQGVATASRIIRDAAERTGRPPSAVRIYATVIVAPGQPENETAVSGGKAVIYVQTSPFGDRLAELNRWDTAPLLRMRAHPTITSLRGGTADHQYHPKDHVEVSALLPSSWIRESTLTGRHADCVRDLHDYLDAGADELVLHGTDIEEIDRPIGLFEEPQQQPPTM
ncbi:TIGR03857 family LLM class F420-dependent oxidoreductase [Streptomyces sp. NPDC048521]|uniref:TIGR03857 family LLM class F420-dependent oxidoreductase n=1 Tax=Streptomyces sp. NPDC048521 TaxID=3365566 RepID=UPI003716DDE7